MSHSGIFEKLMGTLGTAVESVLDNHEPSGEPARPPAPLTHLPTSTVVQAATARIGDAIDQVLAGADRKTAASSLRESDLANAFRDELSNGLIRADTVNRLLQIVDEVLRKLI